MFKNIKLVYLGSNEILAYNDTVAGIFNDYRTTSISAIHQLENRKLTTAEIDQFLDEIEQIEEVENVEDEIPDEETDDVLNKIMKICPEVKYIIHSVKIALAAGKRKQSPEERREKVEKLKLEREAAKKGTKKKIKKSEQIKKLDKINREKEAKKAEKEKKRAAEPTEPEAKPTEPTEPAEPETEDEEESKRTSEEQKRFDQEEQEQAKRDKEYKESDENKRVEKGEEKLKDVGDKSKPQFTGFKGLLFNMYQNIFVDKMDPENKAEREALQQRLRRDWGMYQKNKKLFEKNRGLMDEIGARIEQQDMSPETISLINEAVTRDPSHLKDVDFSETRPSKPIAVYLIDLAKKYKGIKADEVDKGKLEKNIKSVIEKEERVKILKIRIVDKKEREHGRLIEIEMDDWDGYYKLSNKIED